jgi:hypothetical protein
MNEWCIIIQGPSVNVEEIKKSMKDENYIFSTWEGEEHKYINKENVIFNKKPQNPGTGNLFYQQETTINGLLKAKELGFQKTLKIRSDYIVKDINKLIDIFTHEINFFFWHNYNGGYICDYLMAGDINLMIKLWSKNKKTNFLFSEQMILENFFEMELNNEQFNFFLNKINDENDIYWIKYKKFLSSYKSEKLALDYIK